MNGPGTGGKLAIGNQQALLSTMSGGVSGLGGTKDKIAMFKAEDPREEVGGEEVGGWPVALG